MTTTVIVETHAWEVDVTIVPINQDPNAKTKPVVYRIGKDARQLFYVHSGQDIMIHEVENTFPPGTKPYVSESSTAPAIRTATVLQ